MYRKLGSIYRNVGTNPQSYVDRFISFNFQIGQIIQIDCEKILDDDFHLIYKFGSISTARQCIECWEALCFIKIVSTNRYCVVFNSLDRDLIFKSKYNLIFDCNNKGINQYRDSIIFKILTKNNIDVINKFNLTKKQYKNQKELSNLSISKHFGKYESSVVSDEVFLNLVMNIWGK